MVNQRFSKVVKRRIAISFLALICLTSTGGYAADQYHKKTGKKCDPKNPERGRWFHCYEKEEVTPQKKKPLQIPMVTQSDAKKENIKCQEGSWDLKKCGFINPGKSFEFQAMQRDKILNTMAMEPENEGVAIAYVKYVNWVTRQAVKAIATNRWVVSQNQDLDYSVHIPSSSLGLRLQNVKDTKEGDGYWKKIASEGGQLVMFSRNECETCHTAAPVWLSFAKEVGMPIVNASLSEECLPISSEFTNCITSEKSTIPAGLLNVKYVPSLLLYVPHDMEDSESDGIWLKLANNIETKDRIKKRVVQFLKTVRNTQMDTLRKVLEAEGAIRSDLK